MSKPSSGRGYAPSPDRQQLLLAAAPQEWLPDDRTWRVWLLSDVADDRPPVGSPHAVGDEAVIAVSARGRVERRGGPPYNPRMMVKVLLYGNWRRGGVLTPHRSQLSPDEDIGHLQAETTVLAGEQHTGLCCSPGPSPTFARIICDAGCRASFVQVLALCQQAGLVKLGHVAWWTARRSRPTHRSIRRSSYGNG